jgi:hypothetical protein
VPGPAEPSIDAFEKEFEKKFDDKFYGQPGPVAVWLLRMLVVVAVILGILMFGAH